VHAARCSTDEKQTGGLSDVVEITAASWVPPLRAVITAPDQAETIVALGYDGYSSSFVTSLCATCFLTVDGLDAEIGSEAGNVSSSPF
jgi:hypothetical protein